MKFCDQCGTKTAPNAKFCQECGNRLQSQFPPQSGSSSLAAEATYGSHIVSGAVYRSRLLDLTRCISDARSCLKKLKQPIPTASSETVVPLMGRLQTTPPHDAATRIELIDSLGRSGDPVVLRALLLVAGAGSKHVRTAVAVALSRIEHSLSAYILMPMLEDSSSRVRNSAIQALIYLNQPFSAEVIVAACLGNRELKRIAFDTVRRLQSNPRKTFIHQISQVNPEGEISAADLIQEFQAASNLYHSEPHADARLQSGPLDSSANGLVSSTFSTSHRGEHAATVEQGTASTQPATDSFGHLKPTLVPDKQNEERLPQQDQSPAVAATVAALRQFSVPSKAMNGSDEIVTGTIDVSTLDDIALNGLMSELVPVTSENRSGHSVADARFFESISTDLNDSLGYWHSPDDSVFDYNSSPKSSFSDTQSFDSQITSGLEFPVSQNRPRRPASGLVTEKSSSGSSASWKQFATIAAGNSSGTLWPGNNSASDRSRSGVHVRHPAQEAASAPVKPAQTPFFQNQTGPQSPSQPGMYGGLPMSFSGYQPLPFAAMPEPFAAPPAPIPFPQISAPSFPQVDSYPSPANSLNRSVALATVNPQAAGPSTVVQTISRDAVENVGSLAEATLLNGGTVGEVPTMMPAGTTFATTDTQTSTPPQLSVTSTIQTDDPEQSAQKAQGLRNLERLRKARDQAFRVMLNNPETITGKAPRSISKKITTLLTTPARDHAEIKQQLVALGKTGSPHALETLTSFCQKPAKEIRISCAEALGLIKHPIAVVQLLKFLGDKSGTVIETALKSMVSLQDKTIYPVLLAAGLVNASLRSIVVNAIETAPDEHKSAWEQHLLSCLTLSDPDLVAFSLHLLVKLTGMTHLDCFMSFAENTDPLIRAAAIEALVRTGAKRVIGTINEALIDPSPLVRTQAAIAVGTMHSPRSIDLLGKMLQDSSLSVRRSAAQSAAKIEEPDLGDSIVAALKVETDHLVIEYLLDALHKNGGQNSHSLLVQFVEGSDTELREVALKALRKLKLQESVPVFTRLLDDKQPHIRKQAVEQLAILKCTNAIPRLKQMLKADTDEHVRGACARALGELQDRTSLELLESALEDHGIVRLQAVMAMGKIGNSAAAPSLMALLKDSQSEIRHQAVRSIAQLKLVGSEIHLEPLLQDPDVMVRRGVEQALQEFGLSAGQIRRMRFQKSFSKVILAISPSYILAALPGKAGMAVTVMTMLFLCGGVWFLSNIGSFVNGGASLPVLRVENVRASAAADLAVVWRKELVFDVAKASSGELLARIQSSVGTREVLIENKAGVIILAGKTLKRLRPEDNYETSKAITKDLSEIPLGISFHSKNNLCCLFMPKGQGTQLQLLNAESLDSTASHDIKGRFDGRCLVSPDLKMALSLSGKGELSIAELATGEVFKLNVADLVRSDKIGKTRDVQFSADMKYVCFSTTENLFIFTVDKMRLEKQIQEEGGFFSVSSSPDGRLRAISLKGKILEISPDLSSVNEKKIAHYFNLVDVDPEGKLVITSDTDERNADIFDIQQNKVISTIVGE